MTIFNQFLNGNNIEIEKYNQECKVLKNKLFGYKYSLNFNNYMKSSIPSQFASNYH